MLERWQGVNVQQYALDFALRDMVDVHALKELEPDREVQAGVIDIRTLYIETDDEIVAASTRCSSPSSPSACT